MATLVLTITRDSVDVPWKFANELTEEEKISHVYPYREYIISLPGFIETTLTNPDELTTVVTHTFDTEENARSAQALLFRAEPGTFPYEQKTFWDEKYASWGISYTKINKVFV